MFGVAGALEAHKKGRGRYWIDRDGVPHLISTMNFDYLDNAIESLHRMARAVVHKEAEKLQALETGEVIRRFVDPSLAKRYEWLAEEAVERIRRGKAW